MDEFLSGVGMLWGGGVSGNGGLCFLHKLTSVVTVSCYYYLHLFIQCVQKPDLASEMEENSESLLVRYFYSFLGGSNIQRKDSNIQKVKKETIWLDVRHTLLPLVPY